MATDRVERVAHRGAPRERLENTLPSFQRALELGADAVELDVHITADGVVVVHHDETARGRQIRRSSWEDLASLDLGGGATMPRLDDVLHAMGDRVVVYIELKGRDVEAAAVEVARKFGHRYAMHSFDHEMVERVGSIAPDVPRGVLLDRGIPRPADAMRAAVARTRPRDVWPHWSLVDEPFMAAARELGVRVIVWTVNSDRTARVLRDLGVAGLCTDDLAVLANL
ncbi:MAG TPA: glycerophosphodiester phosphodiesterase [Gemmatimonadaceae bacterium]|nr:glycerophosphodiester phosphodiesterase [Gemmatimonadaceae bacterium]